MLYCFENMLSRQHISLHKNKRLTRTNFNNVNVKPIKSVVDGGWKRNHSSNFRWFCANYTLYFICSFVSCSFVAPFILLQTWLFFSLFVLHHVLDSLDFSHKHVLTRRVFVQCIDFSPLCANPNVVRFGMIVVQSITMITTWIHASIMVFLFINKKLCVRACVFRLKQLVIWCVIVGTLDHHHLITPFKCIWCTARRIKVQIKCNEEKCVHSI